MEFRTRLNRGKAIGASLQKVWKSDSIPISTKIRLTKALVWPVATYGCESWTLRKNEETRLDAFEMKGLGKILRVSWTAEPLRTLVTPLARRERPGTCRRRRSPTWGAAARAAFVAAGAAFVRKFLARFNNACRIVDSTWLVMRRFVHLL